MIQAFENISIEDLDDIVESGYTIVSAGDVKDGYIKYVVVEPRPVIEIIYSDSIDLSNEVSDLYLIPTATAGELLLTIMLFMLLLVVIVKWIGGIMFRSLIDFKNRLR